jgi:UDP:flavonoid glycosyltransferase YjiC (YdhE family)
VLRSVVEALAGLRVRALVTLGEMLPEGEVQSTGSVVVVRSAPHGEILRQASLLITHCGHGTTLKALAAGVPIVCMPMGRDQNDTAARVVHASAGRSAQTAVACEEDRQSRRASPRRRSVSRERPTCREAIARELHLVAELEKMPLLRSSQVDRHGRGGGAVTGLVDSVHLDRVHDAEG